MALRPVPDELRHLKQLEKVLISQGLLFKKIVIMHGGQFSKIKKRSKKMSVHFALIVPEKPVLTD